MKGILMFLIKIMYLRIVLNMVIHENSICKKWCNAPNTDTSSHMILQSNGEAKTIKLNSDIYHWILDWFIYWGLTPFLTFFKSYYGGQSSYSCVSWLHTSVPQTTDEWRLSQCLWWHVGKNVGRAGVRTHNRCIYDSVAHERYFGARILLNE